ncbi:MAG: UDP-N-acetylmuramoyl-L-alanyl-D-glutamate--2,6-diaminopimelate ligase, partial [Verrucomicrobia bacterium]|nr:UDP-N-acetylmuramoyl-L-alanyl-D-glutamate--2,6-diaminopimelate ligase [Verrucomicrobiota bacterium]
MVLSDVIEKLENPVIQGPVDRDIVRLCYDSRRVVPGTLFIAVKGENFDGHSFIEQAVDKGAVAVIGENAGLSHRATTIVVSDSRKALATVAAAFYKNPSRKLRVIGVTGTNGKTTTTFLIKHILERVNQSTGLIGTVQYEIGKRILPAGRTTPESLDLQELLKQCVDAGTRNVVMEVSSHAISQNRISEIDFEIGVFTNLTQDHLDFHGSMKSYFEAKARLFAHLGSTGKRVGVINTDDHYGQQLAGRFGRDLPIISYGMGARAEFRASNFKIERGGSSYQLDAKDRSYLVRLPLIGRFNIYNSLAALAATYALGIDVRTSVSALAKAPQIPGRLEAVPAKRQFQIYVDYAHTEDALLNILRTCRDLNPGRLIVVFGCGGDRDRAKRPLMGRVADEYADYSIVTSDNPRKEDPKQIIKDVESGFESKNYELIID